MLKDLIKLFFFCIFLLQLTSCSKDSKEEELFTDMNELRDYLARDQKEPIYPLSKFNNLNPAIVSLGNDLFNDTRLSGDNTLSCATCHSLSDGGADSLKFSVGIHGAIGNTNTPTVFNSALNFTQFWDGRALTLKEQAKGPITNPMEMGGDWTTIINKLSQDKAYLNQFNKNFKDGLTQENIVVAIATFERSLITINSPFDRYLKGDKKAISTQAILGYQRFKTLGCISCHQGENIGGQMFQYFGVVGDYFADRGNITKADLGRFNVTGLEEDKFKFKVPSLRNVNSTAPYFHDGSATTLEQAIKVMGKYQLGVELPEKDIKLLSAFLKTLTGEFKVSE